jgi:cysteine-S-conjugate beta-lyase
MTHQKSTTLIHHPYRAPAGFDAVPPGIYKASTVIFKDTAAMRSRDWKDRNAYTYGLHGTPTSMVLEERIATLEGGLQTLLVPSGLAAIAVVDMALLKSGDEVLIPSNAYGPGKELAMHELASWGIGCRFYDAMNAQSLNDAVTPSTKLIWLEAAGSITMEFPDLLGLVQVCKTRGVLSAIDNTWGAGIAFNAFDLPGGLSVDICMQALTKFPSGGADVLMGSITTRDEALHLRLKATHSRMGWGVGMNDVEMVLRGLPSIEVRYSAHDRAARALAQWWSQQSEVTQVLHPALPESPGHAHWKAVCNDQAAGLFSVVFDQRFSTAQVDAFVDALQLFKIGFSWAGPMSLAVPYDIKALRKDDAWRGTLVRFSLGLEAASDLIADCGQALSMLRR